jgi:hypothetical protein
MFEYGAHTLTALHILEATMSNPSPHTFGKTSSPSPSRLHPPYPGAEESEWVEEDRLGLTPEQAGIMDLLEGRAMHSASTTPTKSLTSGLERDVVLAILGSVCLVAGLISVFFMAALGGVLLVVGALFCVAAYEHAISADHAALMEESRQDLERQKAQDEDKTSTLL